MSWSNYDNWLMTDPRDSQPNLYDLAEDLDADDLFECALEDMPIEFAEYLESKDIITEQEAEDEDKVYDISHELWRSKDEAFRQVVVDFFWDDTENLEHLVEKYCPNYNPYHCY